MNDSNVSEFEQFNLLYKELDKSYEEYFACCGLSACAMWVIYSLRVDGDFMTQTDISKRYFLNKQSVSSAIQKLEKDGYVSIQTAPNNAKNKLLQLTEKGCRFAEETIDKLLTAEQSAFDGLTQEEQRELIRLYQKYMKALKNGIDKSTFRK